MQYCPHCGKKVLKNTKFCPHCGFKIGSAQNTEIKTKINYNVYYNHSNDYGYLSTIINSSFGARFCTNFSIICIIFWIVDIIPFLPALINPNAQVSPIMNNSNSLMAFTIFMLVVVLFLAWLFMSKRGLIKISEHVTPKYRNKLMHKYPGASPSEIYKMGCKHYIKVANVWRTISYVILGMLVLTIAAYVIAAILIIFILGIILDVVGGFFGPTWHIHPKLTGLFHLTHWYY